ncbi:putative DNA-binding transcriptional regulator YafY [Breoghania corrubedonensis]|uniref:Putative DNA-binding transcriptional regulator YafY n=1 Tax=Breoghania corrubedonensis TaxID=665038 RepID=A0A2T5V7C6_9HYPH|nr:YafY family protein [Breoghania corrubedonensis]PTW59662.1 putative DNA-binding transcriptional regulator YafY [Breoghania corrubedonensis]
MSRSERLLDLLQLLRGYRRPVSGATLAAALDVSLRTLYRDIVSLQAQGAEIEGEPGVGYVLKPGFLLPPLMFSEDEIEALVLGMRYAGRRGDARLGAAASSALAKVGAVLPADLRETLDASTLFAVLNESQPDEPIDLAGLRDAIRRERELEIEYRTGEGVSSRRVIWPFMLGFFDRVRVTVAWCALRQDFRAFRTDRILSMVETGRRYPRRRQEMLARWREKEGIPT